MTSSQRWLQRFYSVDGGSRLFASVGSFYHTTLRRIQKIVISTSCTGTFGNKKQAVAIRTGRLQAHVQYSEGNTSRVSTSPPPPTVLVTTTAVRAMALSSHSIGRSLLQVLALHLESGTIIIITITTRSWGPTSWSRPCSLNGHMINTDVILATPAHSLNYSRTITRPFHTHFNNKCLTIQALYMFWKM
jgi:hypothetical protein